MKFTMDGGFNAYDFKDDEEDDADIEKLKALAGAAIQTRACLTHRPPLWSGFDLAVIKLMMHRLYAGVSNWSCHCQARCAPRAAGLE